MRTLRPLTIVLEPERVMLALAIAAFLLALVAVYECYALRWELEARK